MWIEGEKNLNVINGGETARISFRVLYNDIKSNFNDPEFKR